MPRREESMKQTRLEKNKLRRKGRRNRQIFISLSLAILICLLGGAFYIHLTKNTTTTATNETTKNELQPSKRVEANVVPENAIDEYLNEIGFNGTVYIEDKGKYTLKKAYGNANFETGEKNQMTSTYLIGSMQKVIIATAFMQLVEQGKVGLDDPIQKYLPHFPNGHAIKIKNFLGHTTGLNERKKKSGTTTPYQIIKSIERAGVKQQPGKWHYSDDNYAVIAYLIQQLSGMSVDRYVKQHIFMPANMTSANFGPSFYNNPLHTSSYYNWDGDIVDAPATEDMSQLFGAGDMYMTVEDVYKFDEALLSGQFISKKGVGRLLQKGAGKYGFGMYDFGNYHISRGVLYGYESANVFTKDHTKKVILLTNTRDRGSKKAFYMYTRKILEIMENN